MPAPEHPYVLLPPLHSKNNNNTLQRRPFPSEMFRPSKPEDWEHYREPIATLYNTMKLKDVMLEMQVKYNFKAT